MIEIPDWVAFAIILALLVLCLCYLIYFRISRKLFPQVAEFQKEIHSNEEATILTIKGSGIVKKVEMQTSENNNSVIVLTVDRTAYASFGITRETKNSTKENANEQKGALQNLEVNVNKAFFEEFSLFMADKSDKSLNATGKIFYEIKKPLKDRVHALIEEIR
jgi:hypothetical protein